MPDQIKNIEVPELSDEVKENIKTRFENAQLRDFLKGFMLPPDNKKIPDNFLRTQVDYHGNTSEG